jgi:hypothetical protein
MLIGTTATRSFQSECCSRITCNSAIGCWQGPHHVAQKSSITTLPRNSESFIVLSLSNRVLVHLPDVWTMLVTALAGPIWTLIYFRYRRLFPLAVSHAALGTAFYYGICGHNLAREWQAALSTFGFR